MASPTPEACLFILLRSWLQMVWGGTTRILHFADFCPRGVSEHGNSSRSGEHGQPPHSNLAITGPEHNGDQRHATATHAKLLAQQAVNLTVPSPL